MGKWRPSKIEAESAKSAFSKGAFGWQIKEFEKLQADLSAAYAEAVDEAVSELKEQVARRDVNLLSGHDFSKPLASMKAGTLRLKDSDRALRFEADLPDIEKQTSWVRDSLLAIESGLAVGLSPGFRVPPASVVSNAEELIDEPGNPGVQIRQINQAVLYELSIVTRPAYAETTVEARQDDHTNGRTHRRRIWL